MIGRTLAHYKILEKIGEGGMGEVWKAVDTTLDREVAIGDGPEPRLGKPEPVLSDLPLLRRGVAISADGERFVAVVAGEEQSETDQQRRSGIKLVQNWYREFEAREE